MCISSSSWSRSNRICEAEPLHWYVGSQHVAVTVFWLIGTKNHHERVGSISGDSEHTDRYPEKLSGSQSGFRRKPGLRCAASPEWGSELRPAGKIFPCRLLPADVVRGTSNQSAVTHIHAASIFQFLKANFFRPPSLLFDQPSRKTSPSTLQINDISSQQSRWVREAKLLSSLCMQVDDRKRSLRI